MEDYADYVLHELGVPTWDLAETVSLASWNLGAGKPFELVNQGRNVLENDSN